MSAVNEHKSQKIVYLGLGSNIKPNINIVKAVNELRSIFNVVNISNIWESAPIGGRGATYLNGVIVINTNSIFDELKNKLLEIERALGRVRSADKNAPRPIDIDILIYDGEIVDANLWTQVYLVLPMSEVLPGLIYPATGKTIKQLADQLKKVSEIWIKEDLSYLFKNNF